MHRGLYQSFFGDPQGQIKGKINKCLYMAYTGCMDIVCRVEGKAGLVLGEKQGWFQRVLDPGTSINCDWGKEKRREYDHRSGCLLSVTSENKKKKHWGPDPYRI